MIYPRPKEGVVGLEAQDKNEKNLHKKIYTYSEPFSNSPFISSN